MITDILSGIKILKLYAWEIPMGKMIMKNREAEVSLQKRMHFCTTLTSIAFNAYPIVATIVCLIGYIIFDGRQLTPEIAFLTLLFFNLMRSSIYAIPQLTQQMIKAKISFDRIQKFLLEDEVPEIKNTMEPSNKDTIVELYNSTFSWSHEEFEGSIPVLKSLTLEIKEGELIGIIGRVGSGKSSLLSSICGELYQNSGQFYRKPSISIAYVPQEAWIQNLSLKDNILFGKIYDEKIYQKTIEVCALKDDLKQFSAGDETEIGERGLNLSGGQKARVALARAVYQASDLYILDDTLSAVDSHVGTHIFQNVIGNDGILKGKTRIFALNSINFLSKCDKIIVLKEGNFADFGTFGELSQRQNETFVELVKELKYKEEHHDDEIDDVETAASVQSQKRNKSSSSKDTKSTPLLETDLKKGKLINDEKISSEKVSIKIYFGYLKAFGLKLAFGYFIILFIVRTFVESYSQIWMAKWSSDLVNGTKENIENLKIYGYLSISTSIIIGAAFLLIAFGAANASTRLFENLFFSLLRSPMTFFDSTPMGRILARISSDIEQIDFVIPQSIRFLAKLIADCFFYSALAIYVLPELGLFIIPAVYLIANILVRDF
uniref:Uncharacterized protein n=1 Tax=Panagrolaimus davidi TaxID=227884 RepID=A0A914P7Y4_9BILA